MKCGGDWSVCYEILQAFIYQNCIAWCGYEPLSPRRIGTSCFANIITANELNHIAPYVTTKVKPEAPKIVELVLATFEFDYHTISMRRLLALRFTDE